MQLRPYQREAVAAVIAARRQGLRRLLVALPTGAGKTVIFAELIRLARREVLVLAHRDELLEQARAKIAAALARVGDHRRVEIERGEARASSSARVIVASIRSLHEGRIGRVLAGRELGLVIYDECHHAVADANRAVLERVGVFAPDWPGTLVGFTATTRRADGRGLDQVFETIVAQRTLEQMIADGYLRPLRGLRVATTQSLDAVPIGGGLDEDADFEPEALAEAVDVEARNQLVARSILELCRDRRTIAFCVGVRHAEHLAAALNRLGVRAAMVHGEMPKPARAQTLARFRAGEFRVLTNVGVLTEGFDDPGVSAIAMVRPTRSEALYLQCVGRGMRLDPSASDCLVLDFVDLSRLEIVTAASLLGREVPPMPEREAGEGAPAFVPLDDDRDEPPATLAEILARICEFDPLTMAQREEAAAISMHAWLSLGARGMLLHFCDHDGELRQFELKPRQGRRGPVRGVEIWLGDRQLSRASSMSEAIAAVDHELPRYGDPASARADAAWRRHPITPALVEAVALLRPPRRAETVGEAIAHLALAGSGRVGQRP